MSTRRPGNASGLTASINITLKCLWNQGTATIVYMCVEGHVHVALQSLEVCVYELPSQAVGSPELQG